MCNQINVNDFTKDELIKSIVQWLRAGEHLNFVNEYADALEDGTWLDYFKDSSKDETSDLSVSSIETYLLGE